MNQFQCTLKAGYRIYPKILHFKSNVHKVIYFGEKTSGKAGDGLERSNFATY